MSAVEKAPGLDGTLTTRQLVERIAETLTTEDGQPLRITPAAVRSWIARDEDPLPPAYKGKNGQAHRFDWLEFLAWYDRELERQAQINTAPVQVAAAHIDTLDWHAARTISAREQAKRDRIETAKVEGRYGEVTAMARLAEDRARQAQMALLAIPSRLAPVLAVETDELKIDMLLSDELRTVCQQIARAALQALDAENDPLAAAEEAAA